MVGKQWHEEQLALTEVEFEWIRQFYIQGESHACLWFCQTRGLWLRAARS